jgi:hypothetical protein
MWLNDGAKVKAALQVSVEFYRKQILVRFTLQAKSILDCYTVKRYCRNCFHPMPSKAKFCSQCGQKDSDGKVRMGTMVRKLWDTTFHLESKFLRSCWQLFIPGKVTTEFFKGKQDRYPHPLRMFAIVMFLFLFMVNMMLNDRQKARSGSLFSITTRTDKEPGDTAVSKKQLSIFEEWQYQTMLLDIRKDYEALPKAWHTDESRLVVDSLLHKLNIRHNLDEPGLSDSLGITDDTSNITLWGNDELRVATLDMVRFTPEEIIDRYNLTHWSYKLMVRQTIKSFKSPEALGHAMIGSLTWSILALVALMSGVLVLLYWRQKRYYVEHFIFLLHFHTGLMLALLIALIGVKLKCWGGMIFLLIFLGASVFMYLSMRRYYAQGAGKTLLKWLLFGSIYFVTFFVLMVLGNIVVFAVF